LREATTLCPRGSRLEQVIESPALRRSHLAVVLTVLALTYVPKHGYAEVMHAARLTYVVPPSLAQCPDEESFRNQVAARLGYDVFSGGGEEVSVTLSARAGRIRGRAVVTRAGQATPGVRELEAPPEECSSLVSALAIAVAIALDPVHSMAPVVRAAPPPVAASVPEAPPVSPAPPVRPPPLSPPAPTSARKALTISGVGDVLATVGETPGPTLGGELGVALRYGLLVAEARVRVDSMVTPTTVPSGDRLVATVYSLVVSPCAQAGPWRGCVVGRVGLFEGDDPDIANAPLGTSGFASVGLEAGYVLAIVHQLRIRGLVMVEAPLVRTSLNVGGSRQWLAGPVMGGLAFGVDVSPP